MTCNEIAPKLGLAQIQRHVFLCADQTKPKCCSKEQGLEAWDYLKKRLAELGCDRVSATHPQIIFRSKAINSLPSARPYKH